MKCDMFNEYVERCVNSCSLETLKFELKYVGLHTFTGMFQLTSDRGWQYMVVHAPDVVRRDTVLKILKEAIRIAEL